MKAPLRKISGHISMGFRCNGKILECRHWAPYHVTPTQERARCEKCARGAPPDVHKFDVGGTVTVKATLKDTGMWARSEAEAREMMEDRLRRVIRHNGVLEDTYEYAIVVVPEDVTKKVSPEE